MDIEIKAKVRKVGSSFGVLIPKALVDCNALPLGEVVVLRVIEKEKDLLKSVFGGYSYRTSHSLQPLKRMVAFAT